MSKKILVTDHVHPYLVEGLAEAGISCDVRPDIIQDEVMACINKYTGLVVTTKIKVDQLLLDKCDQLRLVARMGSGMENIDLAYAGKKGIECVNSPEGNKVAVAEHVLGMLLSLLHKITKSDHEVRQKRWEREANRGVELTGKTVGIIGYGNTGSSFAKLLSGFDVDILAYDKYKEGFGNSLIRAVGMEDIFKEADIISLHVPLTDETNHMVDETFIKQFHKPIYICNSSRGKVVKTIDLIRGIEGGRVLGAALDVLENEDLQTFTGPDREWLKYLTGSDKVVLTPHIAGWSVESKQRMARVLVDKIIAAMTTAKEYH